MILFNMLICHADINCSCFHNVKSGLQPAIPCHDLNSVIRTLYVCSHMIVFNFSVVMESLCHLFRLRILRDRNQENRIRGGGIVISVRKIPSGLLRILRVSN
ncbi:hypothetical protein POTOM_045947 [Populus tomentosa]|uniref:Uncharacterized protein n=1 Tax=Populus tomentosa TaxID=118781 RepID=A0A8X7YIQ1_POPTO|nr:hypothetical protein POTOM_045947 [Populus tomentosa]